MIATLAAAGVILSAQPVTPAGLDKLDREIEALAKGFGGRLGYHLEILGTGQSIGFRQKERFPSASMIKTALMLEAVRRVDSGELKWTDSVKLWPKEKRHASMWSFYLPDETSLDVDGLVNLMMSVSDNTATVVLAEMLGSDRIEKTLASLGFTDTAWTSYPSPENVRLNRLREQFRNMGVTTPAEMGRLMRLIATGRAASPAGTEKMLRILGTQYWDNYIAASVPPTVKTLSKVGALSRMRGDAAVVYGPVPYILVVITDSQKDQRWVYENEGTAAIRKISSLVWNTLHPRAQYQPPADGPRFAPTGGGIKVGG